MQKVVHAKISCSSSVANEIVAAVTGHRYRVLNYTLVVTGAVTAKCQSASTDLTGPMPFAANGGVSPPESPRFGHFVTAAGEALNLNLGGAVAVAGHLTYLDEY